MSWILNFRFPKNHFRKKKKAENQLQEFPNPPRTRRQTENTLRTSEVATTINNHNRSEQNNTTTHTQHIISSNFKLIKTMFALKSASTAVRPAIARIAQKNNVIALASRDMTVLSKKSGEEYRKQVSTSTPFFYLFLE